MISQKRVCKHKKYEEQYICLEESCLQKSNFKLDCLKCLQDTHPHHECLQHVEIILQDAQKNQKTFLENFEQNLQYCQNLKQKLELDVDEIKQKYSEWMDLQYKTSLQQIEQYELTLNEYKQIFSQVSLTSDSLKTAVEFNLYNHNSYAKQNEAIQQILSQNQLEFIQYFKILFERCFKNYEHLCTPNNLLPKIQTSKGIRDVKQYEKCTEVGCNNEKKKICLEQSCLQGYSILECPTCQGMRHYAENKQSHRKYFVSANELWEQQNKRIEELERFCDNQGQEIKNESMELQARVMGYILDNEQKLKKFKQFVINKENEMQEKVQNFKSLYQKDQLTVYKELFLQQDLSIIAADIVQFSETFKRISNNFKLQCQTEKEICQSENKDLEDQWTQIVCQFQPKQLHSEIQTETYSVSKYIQKMDEQLFILTQENQQYQIQIQQLIKDLQNVKNQPQIQTEIIVQEINKLGSALNKDLKNQNNQIQQTILGVLDQDRENLDKNMNKIQEDNTNLDLTIQQIVNKMQALQSGIQQIIPQQKAQFDEKFNNIQKSLTTIDEGAKKNLQWEIDSLNIKLTNTINNQASNIEQKVNICANANASLKQEITKLNSNQTQVLINQTTQSDQLKIQSQEIKYLGSSGINGVNQEIQQLEKKFQDALTKEIKQSQETQVKNFNQEMMNTALKITKEQKDAIEEFKTNVKKQIFELDQKIVSKSQAQDTTLQEQLLQIKSLNYLLSSFKLDISPQIKESKERVEKISSSIMQQEIQIKKLEQIVHQQNQDFSSKFEKAVIQITGAKEGDKISEKFQQIQENCQQITQIYEKIKEQQTKILQIESILKQQNYGQLVKYQQIESILKQQDEGFHQKFIQAVIAVTGAKPGEKLSEKFQNLQSNCEGIQQIIVNQKQNLALSQTIQTYSDSQRTKFDQFEQKLKTFADNIFGWIFFAAFLLFLANFWMFLDLKNSDQKIK